MWHERKGGCRELKDLFLSRDGVESGRKEEDIVAAGLTKQICGKALWNFAG